MAGVEEENRQRIALFLVFVGAGLILAGVALMIQHYRQIEVHQTLVPPLSEDKRLSDAKVIRHILLLLLVLVGIFSVASFAFLRWSRRFRRWMFHRPQPATPDGDVWAMHRLPSEFHEDPIRGGGPPPGAPPPENG
jgi:uncharacterized membrane protein YidH (DUF202 family)